MGAHAPLEIRPPSLEEVVLGRRGACWFGFGHYRNVLKEPNVYTEGIDSLYPSPRLTLLPWAPSLGAPNSTALAPPTPLSTRKNRGFALWDLQKSRFGQGLSAKNAAKPKDFTFSLNKTLCFTRRNGFLDVVLAPGGSKNFKK